MNPAVIGGSDGFISIHVGANDRGPEQKACHITSSHTLFSFSFFFEALCVSVFILELRASQARITRLDALNNSW